MLKEQYTRLIKCYNGGNVMVVRYIQISVVTACDMCDQDICDAIYSGSDGNGCVDCPWFNPQAGDVIILEVV